MRRWCCSPRTSATPPATTTRTCPCSSPGVASSTASTSPSTRRTTTRCRTSTSAPCTASLLNDRCVTVFELLRNAGYTTCAVGRLDMVTAENWHDPAMIARCVDRFLGSTGHTGPGNYFKDVRNTAFYRDGKPFTLPSEGTYKTDLITTLPWNSSNRRREGTGRSFSTWHTTRPTGRYTPSRKTWQNTARSTAGWGGTRRGHVRYQRLVELGLIDRGCRLAPRDARVPAWRDAQHQEWEAERMAAYAAQVDCLDQSVGRVLDALGRANADRNTLVLFLSDNGASDQAVGALDRPGRPGAWTAPLHRSAITQPSGPGQPTRS
jgi:arylsulfatase A-like enzyme